MINIVICFAWLNNGKLIAYTSAFLHPAFIRTNAWIRSHYPSMIILVYSLKNNIVVLKHFTLNLYVHTFFSSSPIYCHKKIITRIVTGIVRKFYFLQIVVIVIIWHLCCNSHFTKLYPSWHLARLSPSSSRLFRATCKSRRYKKNSTF
jgi:hypothetical protein